MRREANSQFTGSGNEGNAESRPAVELLVSAKSEREGTYSYEPNAQFCALRFTFAGDRRVGVKECELGFFDTDQVAVLSSCVNNVYQPGFSVVDVPTLALSRTACNSISNYTVYADQATRLRHEMGPSVICNGLGDEGGRGDSGLQWRDDALELFLKATALESLANRSKPSVIAGVIRCIAKVIITDGVPAKILAATQHWERQIKLIRQDHDIVKTVSSIMTHELAACVGGSEKWGIK